jgi:hypothetical protein
MLVNSLTKRLRITAAVCASLSLLLHCGNVHAQYASPSPTPKPSVSPSPSPTPTPVLSIVAFPYFSFGQNTPTVQGAWAIRADRRLLVIRRAFYDPQDQNTWSNPNAMIVTELDSTSGTLTRTSPLGREFLSVTANRVRSLQLLEEALDTLTNIPNSTQTIINQTTTILQTLKRQIELAYNTGTFRSYDTGGRLIRQTTYFHGNLFRQVFYFNHPMNIITQTIHQYDAAGRLISISQYDDAVLVEKTTFFPTYDVNHRQVEEHSVYDNELGVLLERETYDRAGVRLLTTYVIEAWDSTLHRITVHPNGLNDVEMLDYWTRQVSSRCSSYAHLRNGVPVTTYFWPTLSQRSPTQVLEVVSVEGTSRISDCHAHGTPFGYNFYGQYAPGSSEPGLWGINLSGANGPSVVNVWVSGNTCEYRQFPDSITGPYDAQNLFCDVNGGYQLGSDQVLGFRLYFLNQ